MPILSSPQHISVTCLRSGQTAIVSHVAIAAHATSIAKVCSDASPSSLAGYVSSIQAENAQGVYGIKLDGDGAPGSFAAFALAPHHRGHDLVFSAVPFYDPEMIHSSDVVFAGVPIGAQETLPAGVYIPRLSLANFSETPLKFSIELADTVTSPVKDADGNSRPPQVNALYTGTIPPYQTGEYVFSGQEAQSGLLHSVVVSTEARPGTYQAKLVSRSTGILYQIELLAKETREMNNAGVHPWTLQGDTQSHVLLFNHSDKDAKAGIFISSGTATVWSSEMFLAPSETREVSINQLQSEKTPDDTGRRISSELKDGVVDSRTPDSGQLTGRLMVTSRDRAMARNFSCGTYYGVCSFYFETLLENIAVGDSQQMYDALADYCNFNPNAPQQCGPGTPMSGTVNYSWSVGATSIITTSQPSIAKPMLQGVSVGTGYANVRASAGQCSGSGGGNPGVANCPTAVSVKSNTPISITANPQLHTGYGDMVSMLVSPPSSNSPTYKIVETVSQTSNTCPWPVYLPITQQTSSYFNVGAAAVLSDNPNIVYPAIPNAFYDELTLKDATSDLPTSTNSCQATATHQYYCSGMLLGTFTDTTTVTHGTQSDGKPASIVSTTQQ